MNEINSGEVTDGRIIDRAVAVLLRLGAEVGEIEHFETALTESEQAGGRINGLDFYVDLDLAYDGDTTLCFSLQVLPDRAISESDAINTVFKKFGDVLRAMVPAPAGVQRHYGFTPDESPDELPDFPYREPVGTSFGITFLLGWDDSREDLTSKWTDISGERKVWQAFEGIVPRPLPQPLDLETVINGAIQFMTSAQLKIASLEFD